MANESRPPEQDSTSDPIDDLVTIIKRSTVMVRKDELVAMPMVDVHFFSVGITSDAEGLRDDLCKALAGFPSPERLASGPSYIELGGELGDQGFALRLIGLGAHLGLWQAITPALWGITGSVADQMAGGGMVMMSGYRAAATGAES